MNARQAAIRAIEADMLATRTQAFIDALREIARGRTDCGRPLAAEVAREKARKVLISYGINWTE